MVTRAMVTVQGGVPCPHYHPITSPRCRPHSGTRPTRGMAAAASRRSWIRATAYGASTVAGAEATDAPRVVASLKLRLLQAVASLDRGLAANGREAQHVDDLVKQLETTAGPVDLTGEAGLLLPGTWRLLYTSGFNSGSLGGRRPGPPAALVPSVLGQVYQRIDAATARLDNIVEFLFSLSLPDVRPFLFGSTPPPPSGAPGQFPESPALRLTLKHDYTVQGATTVRIVFEDTQAELVGSSLFAQLPKFNVPQAPDFLKPPAGLRSATFDVVFLDRNMRVTRGDRGELRVYLRDAEAGVELGLPARAWVDDDSSLSDA